MLPTGSNLDCPATLSLTDKLYRVSDKMKWSKSPEAEEIEKRLNSLLRRAAGYLISRVRPPVQSTFVAQRCMGARFAQDVGFASEPTPVPT